MSRLQCEKAYFIGEDKDNIVKLYQTPILPLH